MNALLSDKRIRLFYPPAEGLEDVEPLYPPETIVCFDRCTDGDPYEDPAYIANLRTILTALRETRRLHLDFGDRSSFPHHWDCVPQRLEYSGKDDKFRLITGNNRTARSINVARITACKALEVCPRYQPSTIGRQTALWDGR